MLSVDNFYWILHQNLVKPCGLDTWYYYPFGDTDTSLVFTDHSIDQPRREYHVLFGFDQEPIWTDQLGHAYDSRRSVWSHRIPKILANSEQSDLKTQVCEARGMLDWYFFYHGFAVLDWFRDGRYTKNHLDIHNVFLSFNRLARNHRAYRIDLFAQMIEADILHHGSVSFHGNLQTCLDELDDPDTRISDPRKRQIRTTLCSQATLPQLIRGDTVTGSASAHFGAEEFDIWQRSFMHVVNETVFYEPKLHLTEKIFKPIVARRPFVLSAAPGNLAYLRSYGFRTFDQWWDESYDHITDPNSRLQSICKILIDLCARPFGEIKDMLVDMQATLDHNHRHLYTDFRDVIAGELIDNFDACIKIWNNGRVDGRQIPVHPDLDSVRRLLAR